MARSKTALAIKVVQQVMIAVIYGGIYTLGDSQSSIQDRFGLLSLVAIGAGNLAIASTIRAFPVTTPPSSLSPPQPSADVSAPPCTLARSRRRHSPRVSPPPPPASPPPLRPLTSAPHERRPEQKEKIIVNAERAKGMYGVVPYFLSKVRHSHQRQLTPIPPTPPPSPTPPPC